MKSAVVLASLVAATAQRGQCYISGDPHVRGFDRKRGWTHHPIFAPGAWWLVNTESGDFQAQAMYSQCGRRLGGRGWQGWKKNVNDSAHCLESVALSSSIADRKSLVIQPPCTWSWGKMTCNDCTADRLPRVTFNGQKVTCASGKWTQVAPDVSIHCRANRAQVKMGKTSPVQAVVGFWGGRGFEPSKAKTCTAGTHGSLHLWMNQNQFGPQCGHCGDFDSDDADDKIYNFHGVMTKSKRALCDADVKDCQSLFLPHMTPTRYRSSGYILPEDDNLCGCAPENACQGKGETRVDVQQACAASYEKKCQAKASPLQEEHKAFFDECMEDVCNGGTAFTDVDADDEAEGACEEPEAMEDDAVCNHCVRPPQKPACYQFVHDGHCAAGWMGWYTDTTKETIDECEAECRSMSGCGFFAFAAGSRTTRNNCSLYWEKYECPDDKLYPEYTAYSLTDKC